MSNKTVKEKILLFLVKTDPFEGFSYALMVFAVLVALPIGYPCPPILHGFLGLSLIALASLYTYLIFETKKKEGKYPFLFLISIACWLALSGIFFLEAFDII